MNTQKMTRIKRAWWGVATVSMAVSGVAQATCPSYSNCQSTTYETITELPQLSIQSNATPNASGAWAYTFTVSRDTTQIKSPYRIDSWTLPVGMDAQVSNLRTNNNAYFTTQISQTDGGIITSPRPWYALSTPNMQMPQVVSTVTFTSPYAPTATADASLNLVGLSQSYSTYIYGSTITTVLTGVSPSGPLSFSVVLPGSPLTLSGTVPEPGTWALMGLGLLGLAASKQRQGRA
jgi:hypothetical protein